MSRIDREHEARLVFDAAGLKITGPLVGPQQEQECICLACGTRRLVRLSNLRKGGIACRWCHGWAKWGEWGELARARAGSFRSTRDERWVRERLAEMRLIPLTAVGDEFTPVGVVCMNCGETTAVMPERFAPERGWNGCERCSQSRKKRVRESAPEVFEQAGLRLLSPCRGEFVPQLVECLACSSLRRVSYTQAKEGTAPRCWTCATGIRADEPHRVYLVRFPEMGVFKVGLTHNRDDRRLTEHELGGGQVVETIVVPDRPAARRLERAILDAFARWSAPGVGPSDFPQGGYSETWLDAPDVPPCSLALFQDHLGLRE
jgi:hypothetical protein